MSDQAIDEMETADWEMETADWEDGPGKRVEWDTKMRAAAILLETRRQAGPAWAEAATSATPSGGVHFSWRVGGNRATLTVLSGNAPVVGVRKLSPSPSRRKELTDTEAVAFVLPAFTTDGSEASYTGPNGDGEQR